MRESLKARVDVRRPRPALARPLIWLWVSVGVWLSPQIAAGQAKSAALPVHAVQAVGPTVADLDRSLGFYRGVLGFEKLSDVEVWGDESEHLQGVYGLRMHVARLRLGDETIELTAYLAPRGRPIPLDTRSNDQWFQHIAIIVRDMDQAYQWLRRHRVEHASPAPQHLPDWNPNAGGIRAFYFKDPDGHVLEILQFPPGTDDPKWHRPSDRLSLGIDHTAIVVDHTEASLAFYRDLLGLAVAGAGENYGPEQERLNKVFGARLRITTLKAATGPRIELLEYLTPRAGRPYPCDARANDIVHWQTRVVARDVAAAAARLRAARSAIISPGVVTLPDGQLGFRRGFLLRDPGGHALQVIEP